MSVTRRQVVLGSAATLSAAALGLSAAARAQAPAAKLKISHQFPGGSLTEGDFRDRLCRRFAADVEKETKGALKFEVYPNSSLMKTIPQFAALRKGALDLSLYPISYAGGEVAETNIGLMPGLVTNYDQAYTWKNAEVGKLLTQIMAEKGIIIVSWVWQAGGVASRAAPLVAAGGRQGHEGAWRQPRNGHDPQGGGCLGAHASVERDLCRDADRRHGRRHDVVDQPHLVPAGGSVEVAHDRPRDAPTGSCSSRC